MNKALLFSILIVPLSVKAAVPYHAYLDVEPIAFAYSQETITGLEIKTEVEAGFLLGVDDSKGDTYEADVVVIHSNNQRSNASGYCYPTPFTKLSCIIWPHVTIKGKVLYSIRIEIDFQLNGTLILFDSDSNRVGLTPFVQRSSLND